MHLLTPLFGIVALVVLCTLVFVPIARAFGVKIPFGSPFHIGERRERDLVTSLLGRSRGTCIFVSGFLLFTCPMFLALIAYDRLSPPVQQQLLHRNSYCFCDLCLVWTSLRESNLEKGPIFLRGARFGL